MKIESRATIPTRGSDEAAGYDLYAYLPNQSIAILPGETIKVNTGIALEVPTGYAGLIYARSGLATKQGLAPANKVGVVDSDYRGEIMVALHNHSNQLQVVENGDRIAQLIITPFLSVEFNEVDKLNDTKRGTGGFGSTDKK